MLNLPCRVVVLCSLYSACQGRSLHRRLTNDLTEVHLSTFGVKRGNTVLVCVWNITYSLLKYTQVSVLYAVSLFPRGLIIEEIVFLELSRKNWVSRLKWHYFSDGRIRILFVPLHIFLRPNMNFPFENYNITNLFWIYWHIWFNLNVNNVIHT
mgnify:CR=1 FL=1